jgi:hypothetical protein
MKYFRLIIIINCVVAEQGLDTDEIIFLEEQLEKEYIFHEQQKKEIADFKVLYLISLASFNLIS